jgi:hypothetical protein
VAHAVEREQADAHDRPGDDAEDEQHGGDDQRLDGQQPVQPRVDIAERRRHHRDGAAAHMVGVHAVAVLVPVLAADGEGAAEWHVARELGVGSDVLAVREDVRREGVPGGVAQLAVGAGREYRLRPPTARRVVSVIGLARLRSHALLAHHALDERQRAAHLIVEPAQLERALLDVRDAAEQQQPQGRQRQERGQQPAAQ